MADYIIGTEAFTKRLDAWLFTSKQEDADFLHKNKNKIPDMFRSYTRPLYRGMFVNEDFINKIQKVPVVLDNHTSWSKDKAIALKFIRDSKFQIQNRGTFPILITLNISRQSQIIDIDSFVLFMGTQQLELLGYDETNLDSAKKEKEVLASKGLRIKKENIENILQ